MGTVIQSGHILSNPENRQVLVAGWRAEVNLCRTPGAGGRNGLVAPQKPGLGAGRPASLPISLNMGSEANQFLEITIFQ